MPKALKKRIQTLSFVYDVTGGDSGAIATHVLGALPKTAVITQAWIHVLTTFTSATDAATIALGYTGAVTAFDAATAISTGTTWDAAAPRVSDAAADGAVGNFVTTAAGDNILATVAVEVLTAGKLELVVEFYTNS
jgi:hypothetical protein